MPQIIVQIWIKRRKNKKKGDYRDVDSIGYGKCYSDLCAAAQSDCDGNRHGCIEGRGKASDCSATYQLLKAEGFIEIDRRRGAVVNPVEDTAGVFREKLEGELALLGAEAKIKGMNEQEFLQLCETIFENLSGQTGSLQFG